MRSDMLLAMSTPEQAQQERDKLSALLRRMRTDAGLTSSAAAIRAGFSQSKLSKIETGALLPPEADVRALCRAYGASTSQRSEVLDLARRLRNEIDSARVILQRGAYRKQREIGLIEADTKLFRDFQPTYVLGLLQTPAYMRRVFAGLPADDAGQAVDARLLRQRILHDSTRQFDLIMTEGALRWRVGPPELMIEQLDRIAESSTLPNVQVGVIPWTAEADVFPGHAFHMYDDRLVIVGTTSATAAIRDRRDIALYGDLFRKLKALAAYGDEARVELRRVRTSYEQMI
jgi:transcriptional regulator with XRE-family HTH domain